MNKQLLDIYNLPNINEYEDISLLSLSESCAVLEEQVRAIAHTLPETERQIIEAYISTRNNLEVETVKTALRWGKSTINSKPADRVSGFYDPLKFSLQQCQRLQILFSPFEYLFVNGIQS